MPEIPWWQGTSLTQEQAHAFYYDQEYLEQFEQFNPVWIIVGGQSTQAIEGVLPGGEKVLLAAQMTNYDGEAVWARISQTEVGGRTMNVFINPDWDLNGAVQVNENTARIIYGWLFQALTEGQFKGQNPETLGKYLVGLGRVQLELPRCEHNEANWTPVIWETKTVDFTKPMELALLGSKQDVTDLRSDRRSLAIGIMDHASGLVDEPIIGGWLTVAEDGHMILVVADSALDEDLKWDLQNSSSATEVQQGCSRVVGSRISLVFRTIGNLATKGNAFGVAMQEMEHDEQKLLTIFDCFSKQFFQDNR